MKRIYLYTLLLGLFSLYSCSEDDRTPVLELKTASELTPLTSSSFTFNKENAEAAFPAIAWSKPDYGFIAVMTYDVTLINNTTTKSVVLAKETADTKVNLTNVQMNQLMASTGAYPGQTYNFSIKVASNVTKTQVTNESSNSLDFSATLFDPATVDWNFMYVAAGYPDWNWTKAYMIGDPDGDGIYKGYVNINADNSTFAVVDGKDITKTHATGQKIEKKGFYEITLDAAGSTVSISPATTWGVIGNATSNGWDKSSALDYDPTTKLWSNVLVLTAGEYKFRANDGWDISLGAISGHEEEVAGELSAGGGNLKMVEPHAYIVTLNLTEAGKYTYSLEKTEVVLSSTTLYMPGSYQGWAPDAASAYKLESPARDFVYSGAHYIPANTTFKFTDGPQWGSEFALVKGDKINWNADKTSADFNLATAGGEDIKIEYANYYRITVDAKKLTCNFARTGWEIIGDATPGKWDAGTVMNYNPDTKKWTVTVTMASGNFKFRWDGKWDVNLGGDMTALTQGGADIPSPGAGSYTFTLDPEAKTCTAKKN